jgi:hypothetical protein
MQKIVLIFPYFGKLPVQYGMWRASALENPSVDFMFFTDADVEPAQNIIVHKMQFDDFRQIVQAAFDFPIILDRPYKLCEYKQAYGYILKDYIHDYDFWGYGDLDLVYGDLRHYLTDDILASYKFFLGEGHLSLLRNDEDATTYFMKPEPGYQDYHDAFTTTKITFFDEYGYKGCGDKWRDCRPNDHWNLRPYDNMQKPKQAYHFNSLAPRNWEQVVFEHVGGKLYIIRIGKDSIIERKESMYAHFQHRQNMCDKVKDYSHFLVTPDVIKDYPKHHEMFWLKYYCRSRNLTTKYYQWRARLQWKIETWRKKRDS